MQHRGGEGRGNNREIGLRTAPWQASRIYVGIWQAEHAWWLMGVANGYLCRVAPDLAEHELVEVVDTIVVPDGRRLLLLAHRWRRRRGRHVVLPPDRAAASTARQGRAERSNGAGGRERKRKRKWREADMQMGWLEVDLGNFWT